MELELYKYGISNTLEDVEKILEDALNAPNRIKKTMYIGEAYGMIKAINALIIENENENNKPQTTSKK